MGILTVVSLSALLLVPPITQDQNYHDFADQRTLLGIPNFWNVVSNLPLYRRRRGGTAAVSSRSGNHCALLRDIFDRLRLVLLSLESERQYLVLGSAADDALLHGNSCRRGRGARECEGGSRLAMATTCNRPAQPVALALDLRSPALCLGAVFPVPRTTAAVFDVSAKIHRYILLDHRRRALRACEVVRILR